MRIRYFEVKGFTLIELLIAISLLAILTVLAWQGLDSLTRTRSALEQRDARLLALNTVYTQLDSDCRQLADPAVLAQPPLRLGRDSLLLIRDRRDPGQPPGWQVVWYRIVAGHMERLQSPPLRDREALAAMLSALREGREWGMVWRLGAATAEGFEARVWVEPGRWMADDAALREVLFPPTLPGSVPIMLAPPPPIRALELSLTVRAAADEAPERYSRICLTGL